MDIAREIVPQVNKRSPKVARLLKKDILVMMYPRKISDCIQGLTYAAKSSDLYKKASPFKALKTKRKLFTVFYR